jgi:trans-aconitate methyltransferase
LLHWGNEDWTTSRRVTKARSLLTPAIQGVGGIWADLGCGDGVFSYLLCAALPASSQLYAVDQDQRVLRQLALNLADRCDNITLRPTHADFTKPLMLPPLDGMVMANALHFVQRKAPVLQQLVTLLKPGAPLVVIEYNARQGNSAVPYPLPEDEFLLLASTVGLQKGQIVTRVPSSFLREMYTGIAHARNDG